MTCHIVTALQLTILIVKSCGCEIFTIVYVSDDGDSGSGGDGSSIGCGGSVVKG